MSGFEVTERSTCRLCGHDELDSFLSFENVPFFDEIMTSAERGNEFSYAMQLFLCRKCLSVQTQHDVNIGKYYETYEYIASKSPFIQTYMESLVDFCFNNLGLRRGDRVIEIGAADGYLLTLFKRHGAQVLGFEAAANLCGVATGNGVEVINLLFESSSMGELPTHFQSAEMIVLLHTFDHLYDPRSFLDLVKQVLNPNRGILVLEVHDFEDIYMKHETALFGHEHATYLHFGSVSRIMELNGFRIVDFNFLPKEICRGSSMVLAVTPLDSSVPSRSLTSATSNVALDDLASLRRFQEAVEASYASLRSYLEKGRRDGKRFAGYGGWGRGVTTMAMAGLNSDHFVFVVDANAALHGRYTPVSDLLVLGPDAVDVSEVDEIIVFNYAYMDEIRKALGAFLGAGGRVTSVLDFLGTN